jgi:lipopolysaccharide/colanic/teichoic acid biosynthesis glycosyltransferase
MTQRHFPLLNQWMLRTMVGLLLAVVSPFLAAWWLGREPVAYSLVLAMIVLGWWPATFLTDKYVHKYPQRYATYLLASHAKAAVIMAVVYLVICLYAGTDQAPIDLIFSSLLIFTVMDLLVSLPRRRQPEPQLRNVVMAAGAGPAPAEPAVVAGAAADIRPLNTSKVLAAIAQGIDDDLQDFLRSHLPASDDGTETWSIVDDRQQVEEQAAPNGDIGLMVGRKSLNDVVRLNLYLEYCASRIEMGGYFVARYTPLDVEIRRLREQYRGIRLRFALLRHFVWYRAIPKIPWLDRLYFSPLFSWIDRYFLRNSKLRTRVLAMAEVWGRLAYFGMEVIAESEGDERFVLAQRVTSPISDRRPSYYAVVALEKVGLDGEPVYLHKVRSMYPFSEFLQKRIFESHGLSEIGKFRDDPRLTDYGPLLRKHWIDELPGLYDWLRGDVKLVGMRATSPHFLSLYPKELYDLYIQTKPGLVPPIFDELTDGFDDIVRIEMSYLKRYHAAPIKTDIQYFWYTFRDIVFRRVRSR